MCRLRTSRRLLTAALAAVLMIICSAAAQDNGLPTLRTNEAYVAAVTRSQTLAIDDPMAVFGYVLDSLPERVQVYPTENHYYFAFLLNGIRYAGNIKIDARLRSEGKLAFSYYEDRAAWLEDAPSNDLVLGASNGVNVEKLEPLAYHLVQQSGKMKYTYTDAYFATPAAFFQEWTNDWPSYVQGAMSTTDFLNKLAAAVTK